MEDKNTGLVVKVIGEDSNVFNLIGIVSKALRRNDHADLGEEMSSRVMSSGSYDEALQIMQEYVEFG